VQSAEQRDPLRALVVDLLQFVDRTAQQRRRFPAWTLTGLERR
jgi:hypothetical protein